jgi:hypothetical protein
MDQHFDLALFLCVPRPEPASTPEFRNGEPPALSFSAVVNVSLDRGCREVLLVDLAVKGGESIAHGSGREFSLPYLLASSYRSAIFIAFFRSVVLVDFRRCFPFTSRKQANQYLERGFRIKLAMLLVTYPPSPSELLIFDRDLFVFRPVWNGARHRTRRTRAEHSLSRP